MMNFELGDVVWGTGGPEFKSRRSDQTNQRLKASKARAINPRKAFGVTPGVTADKICLPEWPEVFEFDRHQASGAASPHPARARAAWHSLASAHHPKSPRP